MSTTEWSEHWRWLPGYIVPISGDGAKNENDDPEHVADAGYHRPELGNPSRTLARIYGILGGAQVGITGPVLRIQRWWTETGDVSHNC